jgi:site-specific DNA-methyltransferase (adenine-specific)
MHLKYHEDIVVFAKNKPTYNPQMQERKSERVKQMQQGNSKNWRSKYKEENEVAFQTNYEPREWTVYDADKKYPSTILQIPAVNSNGKEKVNHPTQKPVALFEYLIKTYTQPGEIVLDNCAGSGTAAIASLNTGRFFIGIEKEPKYVEIARKRVEQAQAQRSLFGTM